MLIFKNLGRNFLMTIPITITKEIFNNVRATVYDNLGECPYVITSKDILQFISNVIRKYSNYVVEEPTFEQAIQGIEFLLKGTIPKDEIIKIAFENWLNVNKTNILHYKNILWSVKKFYEALIIKASLPEWV